MVIVNETHDLSALLRNEYLFVLDGLQQGRTTNKPQFPSMGIGHGLDRVQV